ncbi:MAG TPA: hypothetical protein VHI52_08340 [Verrucomicrobiae bacterium]|nr:hypothetical protein [Verrucomicrobiae bacterium]
MPLRINLLAEAQALEEMRRRDPVKRSIWVGVFLVCVMFAWWSSVWAKSLWARTELNHLEGQLASRTNDFQQVLDNQRKLNETINKLTALQEMATNRLLYGTLLNALQRTTVDDVQLLRFRADQNYFVNDEVKAKTNANGRITPGRPATVTERTVVTLDARDSGSNPGDQVNKFKRAVGSSEYFLAALGGSNEVRLTSLSPPQFLDGKPSVQFTLECRYPEKTR